MFRGFTRVWTILFFCGFPPWTRGKFTLAPEDFGKKLLALYKVVDYIYHRPRQMNADVTLSVTLIEANVAAVLVHENARHLGSERKNMLELILNLSDATRRQLLDNILPEHEDIRLVHNTLNYPSLWLRPITWRYGAIKNKQDNTKLSNPDIRDMVMQGTPKEDESDRCLAELVRNKLNSIPRLPDSCFRILSSPETARGYPLTHRLLIVLIARAMELDENFPTEKLILSYCTAILRDLIDIEAVGFPYQTPDLMMEQVVLCGMEGFHEFTRERYERLILQWAHPSGCFSSFRGIGISRRASRETDYGCDSHATGLAAAALSLFIRENVENARE